MASQPDAGAVADGQPGDRLAGPGRYRMKDSTITALHWDGYPVTATVIIDWILACGGTASYHDGPSALRIDIPGGTVTAVPGDWIIRYAGGLFWVLSEGEFASIYELTGEALAEEPRPGDQQLPVPNDGPSMHDLVIADLRDRGLPRSASTAMCDLLATRKQIGLERYGSLLQAGNGRDWRRDMQEELADAAVYARQGLEESGLDADLGEVYHHILTALFWAVKLPGAGRG